MPRPGRLPKLGRGWPYTRLGADHCGHIKRCADDRSLRPKHPYTLASPLDHDLDVVCWVGHQGRKMQCSYKADIKDKCGKNVGFSSHPLKDTSNFLVRICTL